jgi:hypothetical protein
MPSTTWVAQASSFVTAREVHVMATLTTFAKSVVGAAVVTLFVAATVCAQAPASSRPAAGGARTASQWIVPRTPWGDNYT